MVGYSKWSKVKRSAAFSQPVKEITVAVRFGDFPENPRLRPMAGVACAANDEGVAREQTFFF